MIDDFAEERLRRIREQAAACLERRRNRTAARAAFNTARGYAKDRLHQRRSNPEENR